MAEIEKISGVGSFAMSLIPFLFSPFRKFRLRFKVVIIFGLIVFSWLLIDFANTINFMKQNPLLVKGITRKEVRQSVEVRGNTEKHIETDQIKIVIHAFNRRGELLDIQ